jgi:hypothetical protein
VDDFDRAVRRRLDLPLNSPYSLTFSIILYGLILTGVVWIFGEYLAVMFLAALTFGFVVLRWLVSRSKTRNMFLHLAREAHLRYPDVDIDEVLLGTFAAWESKSLPPIRILVPERTSSAGSSEDGSARSSE